MKRFNYSIFIATLFSVVGQADSKCVENTFAPNYCNYPPTANSTITIVAQ